MSSLRMFVSNVRVPEDVFISLLAFPQSRRLSNPSRLASPPE